MVNLISYFGKIQIYIIPVNSYNMYNYQTDYSILFDSIILYIDRILVNVLSSQTLVFFWILPSFLVQ